LGCAWRECYAFAECNPNGQVSLHQIFLQKAQHSLRLLCVIEARLIDTFEIISYGSLFDAAR
jgi:hypothetical protein